MGKGSVRLMADGLCFSPLRPGLEETGKGLSSPALGRKQLCATPVPGRPDPRGGSPVMSRRRRRRRRRLRAGRDPIRYRARPTGGERARAARPLGRPSRQSRTNRDEPAFARMSVDREEALPGSDRVQGHHPPGSAAARPPSAGGPAGLATADGTGRDGTGAAATSARSAAPDGETKN